MMSPGRRSSPLSGTSRRKQIVAGAIIGVAIVLDLIAAMLSSSTRVHSQTVAALYGCALGLLLVGLIWMILNRKRS
jgi:hypothetical protein